MDLRGIFWMERGKKYRVRVTRNNATYLVGYYREYDDALVARNDFLKQIGGSAIEPEQYSKRWFMEQAAGQAKRFSEVYAGKKGIQFITVGNGFYVQQTDKLKVRTRIENGD